MGYRSEVAIKVYGDDESMSRFQTAYDTAYNACDQATMDEIDTWMRDGAKNGFADNVFTFHATQIKWYDDFLAVKFFDALMEMGEDAGASVEFIRIGDDYDDIESKYYGENCEWCLGVERFIDGI
jgi:hypothetical protein